jgi:hypothetical protein
MVNLLSRFFADKRKVTALEREVEELKEIIRKLIPMAENSVEYNIAGYRLGRYVKQLQERLGIGRPFAGVF